MLLLLIGRTQSGVVVTVAPTAVTPRAGHGRGKQLGVAKGRTR